MKHPVIYDSSREGNWISTIISQAIGRELFSVFAFLSTLSMFYIDPLFGLIALGMNLIFMIYLHLRDKRFIMHEDRIEYYYLSNKKKIHTIYLKDIYQVRFEDQFSNTADNPIINFMQIKKANYQIDNIFVYVNKDVDCQRDKDGKIILPLRGISDQDMILILDQFKENGAEVLLSTKREKILDALLMENWTKP